MDRRWRRSTVAPTKAKPKRTLKSAKQSERLYLRNNVYWAWGYDANGRRWRESTHQTELGAARLAAREINRRYAANPDYGTRTKTTVAVALTQLLDSMRTARRAKNTLRASTYHVRHLTGSKVFQKSIADVSLGDTTAYLEERLAQGAHRHTVSKELQKLTQAYKRCVKLGMFVPTVDAKHLVPEELGTVYVPRERWLPDEEREALLKVLGASYESAPAHRRSEEDRRDYVEFWCETGLRETELYTVSSEHYNEARCELLVMGTKTLGSKRVVPLTDKAQAILKRRIAAVEGTDDPVFPRWDKCNRDLKRACKKAGIAPASCNDFRRTFCSKLVQAGVPERVAAELLGHVDSQMVRKVYGRLAQETLHNAVALLNARSAPSTPEPAPSFPANPPQNAAEHPPQPRVTGIVTDRDGSKPKETEMALASTTRFTRFSRDFTEN